MEVHDRVEVLVVQVDRDILEVSCAEACPGQPHVLTGARAGPDYQNGLTLRLVRHRSVSFPQAKGGGLSSRR